ncbi:MAG: DUF5666 domain-containing protein [Anaerolineae bacterium]|jgi:hypothetical protein
MIGSLVLGLLLCAAGAVWAQESGPRDQGPWQDNPNTQVPRQGNPNAPQNTQAGLIRAALGPNWTTVAGQVAAIEATGFQLQTPRGEWTVQVDAKTRYHFPDVESPDLDDLTPESEVFVGGMQNEDGSLLAWIVGMFPERPQRGRLVTGQITAIGGATLTLALRSGHELSVLTDENTHFSGLDELSADDIVAVKVVRQRDDSLYAQAISPARAQVGGRISAIEGDAFTLTVCRRGEVQDVTVLTDENTRFRLPGDEDAGLDDLEIGQTIGVAGTWNGDGSLQANFVGTRPGRSGDDQGVAPRPEPALP